MRRTAARPSVVFHEAVMNTIRAILKQPESAPISDPQRQAAAGELSATLQCRVHEASLSRSGAELLASAAEGRMRRLVVVSADSRPPAARLPEARQVEVSAGDRRLTVVAAPRSAEAAAWLRTVLPWTAPRPIGLQTSAGLGDRLGLATPGHLAAVAGTGVAPFVAQQSIREMTRTQRSPTQVMDDACWGVFQAGWREGFGSDADHLKTTEDIDRTLAAGFTMFTIDPGDHVNADADAMPSSALPLATEVVVWDGLEISGDDFVRSYAGRRIALDGGPSLTLDEESVCRAAVKYGAAIAHTLKMYRHLSATCDRPFELEVSVDETETPTSAAEHYIVAAELRRLGVRWVSLAPRFVGDFEKGIDYKGDLDAFARSFALHAAIARTLGPYKISLHSGSDKFSVYPICAEHAGGLVHLKTAGTSYLEALRVVARRAPDLFRGILDFALSRFEEDRRSYHISASPAAMPRVHDLPDDALESLLDGNDGRQILHVTFGSVLLARGPEGHFLFRDRLMECLLDHEDEHHEALARHLGRHVRPFARPAP